MNEIKIMNMRQVAFYVSKGEQPLRIEVGREGKIVFIYTKEQTNGLFSQWLKLCKDYRNQLANY